MMELSDELLMAYVDGQLDKPQTAVVSRLLRDDAELSIRVSRLQQTQAQLLDTFGALVREGASATRQSKPKKQGLIESLLGGGNLIAVGTAAILLVIGGFIGLSGAYFTGIAYSPVKEVAQLPTTNWPGDIVEFHSFFDAETMRVSPESQGNSEMIAFQLSQNFSGIAPPDLSEQRLKLVRGQMLNYRGNKVMQLAYLGRKRSLVALYVTKGGLDLPMSPGRFGDLNSVSWSQNGIRYVLAGNMPHQPLQALAVIAKAQLGKK